MEISFYIYYDYARRAGVAQLVEHLIRNEGVVGSSPITGTRIKNRDFYRGFYFIVYAGAISLHHADRPPERCRCFINRGCSAYENLFSIDKSFDSYRYDYITICGIYKYVDFLANSLYKFVRNETDSNNYY